MMATRLLLALGLLPAVAASYARKYGKKRCPCLNATLETHGGDDCHYVKYSASDENPTCFSRDYGRYCAAWDAPQHSACLAEDDEDTPAFCESDFCYVNATECIESNVSMWRSSLIEGMYYSYETCSATNQWSDYAVSTALAGKTLTVEVAGEWAPFAYECTPDVIAANPNDPCASGDSNLRFAGLHGEFIQRVADAAGFDIEWRLGPTAASYAESRAQGTWSWDACVIDVQKGIADICVQYMWETSARRSRTQFSTYFEMDQALMFIKNPKSKTTTYERATAIFEPFTKELWGLIFLVSIVVGVVYVLLDDKIDARRLLFRKDAAGRGKMVATITSSMYQRVFDLWSAAHSGEYDHENVKQRIVVLPWAFFITIVLAAYTANLAAFLGRQEIDISPASVDDCASDTSCTFCTSGYSQTVDALARASRCAKRGLKRDLTVDCR